MATMNSPSAPQKPRLLDSAREAIRSRHYIRNTENAYVAWIRRIVIFHGVVQNRGPAVCPEQRRRAVRSPADRLAVLHSASPTPPSGNGPAELGRSNPQLIPVRPNAPPVRPGQVTSRGYPDKLMTNRNEIGRSPLQP